jgi:hypothetical protein
VIVVVFDIHGQRSLPDELLDDGGSTQSSCLGPGIEIELPPY